MVDDICLNIEHRVCFFRYAISFVNRNQLTSSRTRAALIFLNMLFVFKTIKAINLIALYDDGHRGKILVG